MYLGIFVLPGGGAGGHTFSAVDPLLNRRRCVTLPVGGGGRANAGSK
jgi:hypothetical protein